MNNKKNILVIICISLIAFIILISLSLLLTKKYDHFISEGIPKIIHQTAPADKSKWKPEWYKCQETWKKYFPEPEYTHIMWTDEDFTEMIKNEFPQYYETFIKLDKNIKKIDAARYFILKKYGGIYADMDYECFKNFFDLLPKDKVSITESPYPYEKLQNALMISPKEHPFWQKVINKLIIRKDEPIVVKSTGPMMISAVFKRYPKYVNVLPKEKYNPTTSLELNDNTSGLYARHLCTFSWKNES